MRNQSKLTTITVTAVLVVTAILVAVLELTTSISSGELLEYYAMIAGTILGTMCGNKVAHWVERRLH